MSLTIKLIRHGQSEANVNGHDPMVADCSIPLTPYGKEQAHESGWWLSTFLHDALVFCSPYTRTRQTFEGIKEGSGDAIPRQYREDPRIREVDHGYADIDAQEEMRKKHKWFFYRFSGGESPADCYDRTSTFLESMMREVKRQNVNKVLIVSHGMTIRCFVTRFLHLTVEQFASMANPQNCQIITIAARNEIQNPLFYSEHWAVEGLTLRDDA